MTIICCDSFHYDSKSFIFFIDLVISSLEHACLCSAIEDYLCKVKPKFSGETQNKKNINITEWSPYRVNELLSGDQAKHPVEDCKDLEDFVNSNLFHLFSFNELIWRIIQQRKIKITSFVEIWTWKEKVWDPLESCVGWMMQAITSWVSDTLRIEPEPTDFLAK